MRTRRSIATEAPIAWARAEIVREFDAPKSRAAPMSMNAEEKAPRTKYLSAASWDSCLRLRAVAASTYSGSDMTSRATKSATKLSAAGNTIMPPNENRARGKTSERW